MDPSEASALNPNFSFDGFVYAQHFVGRCWLCGKFPLSWGQLDAVDAIDSMHFKKMCMKCISREQKAVGWCPSTQPSFRPHRKIGSHFTIRSGNHIWMIWQVTPDSQPFKYGEPRAATMGTCPRDVAWISWSEIDPSSLDLLVPFIFWDPIYPMT
jgi:hypothetical protein